MADQIARRGGTAAENDAFTGVNKEITVDTTNKQLRVHDGAKAGGFPQLGERQFKLVDSYAALEALDPDAHEQVYVRGRSTIGDGSHGVFIWRSGDQSANVTADTEQGVWVAPDTDTTGASGAFERQVADIVNARWWGAHPDNSAADNTTAFQAAINWVSNQFKTLFIPSGVYNFDKLYLHYDVINNPGFQSDESKRGRFSIIGEQIQQSPNILNSHELGTVLKTAHTADIPVIADVLGADATVFPQRGTQIEDIQIHANRAGWAVKLAGVQSWTLKRVRVVNEHADGSGLWVRDSDQMIFDDIVIVGPSAPNAGTVGFKFENIDIDSSVNRLSNMLVRRFQDAYHIGATPTGGNFVAYSTFSCLASNDCTRTGAKIADRTRSCVFLNCQFRGNVYGVQAHGRQESNLYLGCGFGADGGSGTEVAHLELGDAAGTAGQNVLRNCMFLNCTFNAINVRGVYWRGQSNLTNTRFENCRFFGTDAAANIVDFNGAPQGGRFINNNVAGTYSAVYAGTDHAPHLDQWRDYVLGRDVIKSTQIATRGTDVASATTIDLDFGQVFQITGNTDINAINYNGGNPSVGTQITLYFVASAALLSTAGGGSGSGNIAIQGGDFTGSGGRILTLTFLAGNWRAM